jgi:hypothetical protein
MTKEFSDYGIAMLHGVGEELRADLQAGKRDALRN